MKIHTGSQVALSTRIISLTVRMMPKIVQRIASKYYFFRQIKKQSFRSAEIEWDHLKDWLREGDFVIDIGANIGRYTLKMSELVGPLGHVISVEPLKSAFDLLTHFVYKGKYKNITLLNVAATDVPGLVDIIQDSGPKTYIFETHTQSHIQKTEHNLASDKILALNVDALTNFPNRVRLVKIDVEGHELPVIKGMTKLIERDHPILIVEDSGTTSGVKDFLEHYNYQVTRLSEKGRNLVFIQKVNT